MFAGVASAQLDKQEQKCANSINKGAAKVAKAQAGDNAACVKNGSKGKLTTSIEACLTGDVKGKVGKAISKIKTGDCSGAPSFLPGLETSSAAIGDIMKAKDLDLIHDIFGTDLDVSVSTDKAAGGCQAAIAKAVGKCQDAKLSSFNACKKDALKAGDTNIEACLGTGTSGIPDGKGKIQKKCGGDFGIGKKCGGQNLNALLPGCAPNAGAGCIDQKIECRVCLALNALDGLGRDCDLFDDGIANGSCGEADPPFTGNVGSHKCVLDTTAPNLTLLTASIPIPPAPLGGSIDIQCGTVGANGKAPCDCEIQDLTPFELTGIGFICFTPGSEPCPTGEIDCDGGNDLQWSTVSDHNIGACTGQADCNAQCDSYCAGMGMAAKADQDNNCEGFCNGGVSDGAPCTLDTDCLPGGACSGGDGIPHGNVCGCQCLAMVGPPSAPGDLKCQLPTTINVEDAAPCGDGDILIAVGTVCIPLSTESSENVILNSNNLPGTLPVAGTATLLGQDTSCFDLAQSNTSGMRLVGQVDFFDSAIGDIKSQLNLVCQ